MRGDKVEVWIEAGAGRAEKFVIEAAKDGRWLEVNETARATTVTERSRGKRGKEIRTWRFQPPRVLALMEHPAAEVPLRKRTVRPVNGDQMELGQEAAS